MDCENRLSDPDSLVRELMRYLRKVRYDGDGDGLITVSEMSNRESTYVARCTNKQQLPLLRSVETLPTLGCLFFHLRQNWFSGLSRFRTTEFGDLELPDLVVFNSVGDSGFLDLVVSN